MPVKPWSLPLITANLGAIDVAYVPAGHITDSLHYELFLDPVSKDFLI